MLNPVEIERRFHEVRSILEGVSSLRLRWKLIADFMTIAHQDPEQFDTYIIQLIPEFPTPDHLLSYAGIDPEEQFTILNLLHDFEQVIPELKEDPHYIRARNSFVKATGLQLAIVGDFRQLIELYRLSFDLRENADPEWIKEIHWSEQHTNLQKLETLADAARGKGLFEMGKWLNRLTEHWKELRSNGETHSLYIPVVETHPAENIEKIGRLRKLSARVSGENETKSDQYSNNFAVVGAEKFASAETKAIDTTVRSRINETHPALHGRYFDIMIHYVMNKGWQAGFSSELGTALLSYCVVLDYTEQRERFTVHSNLTVTGQLDDQGNVLAVEEEGIESKVKAAFFSWTDLLVVPHAQKHRFNECLSILQEKYPNRDPLVIKGIKHFDELFFDRRITRHEIERISRYYLRRAWEQKFSIAGVVVIVLLLMIIARLWYGPIDKNPVNGVFKGEHLFVENQYGQTIAQLDAGYRSDRDAESHSSDGSSPQVQFVDINDDNINEVIWSTNSSRGGRTTEYFKCWSVTGDSLVWQRAAKFDMNFPRKSGMVDDNFFILELAQETLRNDKTYIVGRLTMREMFPGLIVLIDPSTGEMKSKYAHTGQISGMELVDITGNEIRELIMTGMNNAFTKAFVGALNLQNIKGHSPLQGDYEIEGFEPAHELHYLLIPKTKVGQYFDPIERYNSAGYINVSKEDSLFSVWIRDGQASAFEGIERSLRIIAHFDFNFKPRGFSTSDQYDIVAEELYQEGKIDTVPDYEYFEAFKDSILYWDGDQFTLSKNWD